MDEFTVYLIVDLVISAIVAAFTYGFGPVTVAAFWGRPIQKKKFKIFCIIYTIVVWFSWQMYRESSGNGVSIVPAILWGYVSYLISRKIMNKKYDGQCKAEQKTAELELAQQNALPEPEEAKSERPVGQPVKEPEIQRWYTCPKCGQLVKDGEECDCEAVKLALEEEKKKKEEQKRQKKQALKKSWPIYSVCALLLVAVCALGFYSYNLSGQIDELSSKNAKLTESNKKLSSENQERLQSIHEITREKEEFEKENSDLKNFLFPLVEIIAFASKDMKYHHAFCPTLKSTDQGIWLDRGFCEDVGYNPCKECADFWP